MRYAAGISSMIEVPGVLNAQRSTAMPDRARPWSAISFFSFCAAGLGRVRCRARVRAEAAQFHAVVAQVLQLVQDHVEVVRRLSWLNRYAQVPIEMRAFAMTEPSRFEKVRWTSLPDLSV